MKKYIFLISILFTLFISGSAQDKIDTGLISVDSLTEKYEWYRTRYNNYQTDKKVIKTIRNKLRGYKIIVFAGSWCPDTHKLLPEFLKVINDCRFNKNNLEIYFLDMNKTSPEGKETKYNVHSIPTFIFLKKGKEKGRIVESANISIEEDLIRLTE
jgi:thiol-disulfide isomerase/thioredoxin